MIGDPSEPSPNHSVSVRCVPSCGDHSCGGDGCGGSCGSCGEGSACDGAYCRELPSTLSCGNVQWCNSALTYGPYMSYGWWDTDLAVSASSRVQIRHNSRLDRTGVYAWGYMPEFTDLVTGKRFRLLHLRPAYQWATTVGKVYQAATSSASPVAIRTTPASANTAPARTSACRRWSRIGRCSRRVGTRASECDGYAPPHLRLTVSSARTNPHTSGCGLRRVAR